MDDFRQTFTFDRRLFDKSMRVVLDMTVGPLTQDDFDAPSKLKLTLEGKMEGCITTLKPWQRKSLERGFESAVSSGPMMGCPVTNLRSGYCFKCILLTFYNQGSF